ncbi:MAG: ATP-binding protein [Chloroflexi bacterium]|nr:ATP-binding protein [Chloroflexota bacterium]
MVQSTAREVTGPKSAAFVEQEMVSSTAWLISIRWWAGLGVLALTWLATMVLAINLPALPLYGIGLAILAYNAVFEVMRRRLLAEGLPHAWAFGQMTRLQIALDYVAMAALIHFSGGLESPATIYFIFHIIIAGTLLSPRATYLYTTLAVGLVGTTAALEYFGLWPHVRVPELANSGLYQKPLYALGNLFFFATALYVTAYLVATLNVRLRKRAAEVIELSERLRRAYSRLQTLYENAQAANSTLELAKVLDRFVQSTARAMGVRACSICLLDETGTRLNLGAAFGLSERYMSKGDLILEANPLAREVMAGRTIITADARTASDLQYPADAVAEGICSMLSAPMRGKEKPFGLLRAYSTERNHFSQEDAEFLAAIATQGSIAIENAMAFQALSQLNEGKSKFVLTVTHELRSPVGVIRSLLRTMLSGYTGPLADQQRDMVERALHRTDALQNLIDDLLDLAAGKSELGIPEERVKVRLDQAVEYVVKQFQIPAQEKQIRLEWHCEPANRSLLISATHEGIERVLGNLVSNAVKYTRPEGCVQLRLRRTDSEIYLQVSDTGIGIPEEAVPHICEEFYRAPNAKAIEKEGTGLGLAIVKNLVEHWGGRITVESKLGQGTTFTLIFPTVRD